MYVEGSYVKNNEKARLVSPMFRPSMKCLKFYYHMNGRQIGNISLSRMNNYNNKSEQKRVKYQL